MQFLRRWATENQHAHESVAVSEETARFLSTAALDALSIIDSVWEARAGRRLTDFEKFGPTDLHTQCPDCGQPVMNFFDHIATNCLGLHLGVDE